MEARHDLDLVPARNRRMSGRRLWVLESRRVGHHVEIQTVEPGRTNTTKRGRASVRPNSERRLEARGC